MSVLNNNSKKKGKEEFERRIFYEPGATSSDTDIDSSSSSESEEEELDTRPEVKGLDEIIPTDGVGMLILPTYNQDEMRKAKKVFLHELVLKNERIDSKMEWFPQQYNGEEHVVPCPFVSMDLVKLHDLKPINFYDSDGNLRPIINTAPDDPEHEKFQQVIGIWRSLKWGTEVPIQQFRWDILGTDFTISIEGKRRTGKTHFITGLCYQYRRYFTDIVIFTKTSFNGDFEKFVPKSRISNDFNSVKLNAVVDHQQSRYFKAVGESKTHPEGKMQNIRLLVICDDVLSSKQSYRYNKAIDRLFFEGRHYKAAIIVTSQDSKGLPPALKQNTDLKIIFPMTAKRDRETVMENAFTFVRNDNEYRDFIDQLLTFKHQFAANLNAKATLPGWLQVYSGAICPIEEIPKYVMGTFDSWRNDQGQLASLGEWGKGLCTDSSYEGWDIEPYMFDPYELKKERKIYPFPAAIKYVETYKRSIENITGLYSEPNSKRQKRY